MGRGGPGKETEERDETDELGMLMCRGHKTVVKFFSSEVADLEPVLALLLRCDAEVSPDDMSIANKVVMSGPRILSLPYVFLKKCSKIGQACMRACKAGLFICNCIVLR